jgi:hypothetical protein
MSFIPPHPTNQGVPPGQSISDIPGLGQAARLIGNIPNSSPGNPKGVPSGGVPGPDPFGPQTNISNAIAQELTYYDLNSLTPWVLQQIQSGMTADEIDLNLRTTDAFKTRFWMIDARNKAGLPPISPTEVVQYEQTASDLAKQYNLPPGFMDRTAIGNLIANDVSATELNTRITQGYDQVANTDPSVRAYFSQQFGVNGDGALAAFFLDPSKAQPVLEQQARSAEIGGAGANAGFAITGGEAGTLAAQGVTASQAQSGFNKLSQMATLFQRLPGEAKALSADTGAAAVLGNDAAATDAVRQQGDQRQASAAGRVGVEESPDKGFLGLGTGK